MLYMPERVGPKTAEALKSAQVTEERYLRACQRLRHIGIEVYYIAGTKAERGWRMRVACPQGRRVVYHTTSLTGGGLRHIVSQH